MSTDSDTNTDTCMDTDAEKIGKIFCPGAGWIGSVCAMAGELVRHAGVMVAMNEATIGTAVCHEDAQSYEHTMRLFKAREDLYKTDIPERLRYGLEFQARYTNGEDVPCWLYGGELDLTLGPVTEVGFNALSFRMGIDMPETRKWILAKRPVWTNGLFMAFESLTRPESMLSKKFTAWKVL
ncbi:hypothetical protein PENANT_c047G05912 [Penicillium antarcticum]|uniref:Uncharacterized protein n=1 Tax=Penicillium antarcticum TaxID=416450 RepID=A0A1V6PSY1_9EURO|nr:hypothetical protein PENANT_c047G05912 [Penicillium antarcticum]